jgi:hypothetical protein
MQRGESNAQLRKASQKNVSEKHTEYDHHDLSQRLKGTGKPLWILWQAILEVALSEVEGCLHKDKNTLSVLLYWYGKP